MEFGLIVGPYFCCQKEVVVRVSFHPDIFTIVHFFLTLSQQLYDSLNMIPIDP